MTDENQKNKRNIQDVIISGFRYSYYSLTEPARLKIARFRFEKEYQNNNENPLITVYCPTYNRGQILIERAVKSILSQTYKNFELLIIGDCCTDNTEELISKINDDRIVFYNIPKRGGRYPETAENHWLAGPVVAANTALKMAKGKWIARTDDDDVWTKDHLELLLKTAEEGNYEFVSALCQVKRYGTINVRAGEHAQSPYYTRKKKEPKGYNPKIGGTSSWLYRSYLKFMKYNLDCWRKKWNRVNDVDLSIRMFKAGVRMDFIEKVLYYCYPRPGEETIGLDAYKNADEKGTKTHS